jgi:competence protein ComEC
MAQAYALWKEPIAVTFLDVGQGDGALISLPGAELLIDAGPIEAGRNVILPYLRCKGINRLDLVVVTHPDLDHYGGLAYVAEHVAIGKVVYPGIEADTHAWLDLRAVLARRGVPMIAAHRGQSLCRYPGFSLSVLSPAYPGQFPERNDNSVVTFLELRRNGAVPQRFLFTGDMEAPAQEFLLSHAYPNLEGAILKVPHHGSDRSNPPAFLQAIHPGIAILSAGRKNRFGHPGPATVEALRESRARIFLTANQGAVLFEGNRSGDGWRTFLDRDYATPAEWR